MTTRKYNKKEKWEKAEKRWLDKLGKGRQQPGSGNKPGSPGDVRFIDRVRFSFDGRVLLESKQTEDESISVKNPVLYKITREATNLGCVPMLGLEINQNRWLCIPEWAIEIIEGEGDAV